MKKNYISCDINCKWKDVDKKKWFINKNTNLDLFSLKLNRNFQQNNESINYILLFIFATENWSK